MGIYNTKKQKKKRGKAQFIPIKKHFGKKGFSITKGIYRGNETLQKALQRPKRFPACL